MNMPLTFRSISDCMWTYVAVMDNDTGKKVAEVLLDKLVLSGDTIQIQLTPELVLTLE